MSTATAYLIGWLAFTPALAPVPQEPPPDPLARGYLGITVQTGALTVSTVEPNTPAAKAGLKPGDRIVRVGTLTPQVFEQVVAHICGYRPGAIVEIEVERGTEKKIFKVTLAPRPEKLDRNLPLYPQDD